jgi:hypothetical protein
MADADGVTAAPPTQKAGEAALVATAVGAALSTVSLTPHEIARTGAVWPAPLEVSVGLEATTSSGGMIYTEGTMRSLEELLEQNRELVGVAGIDIDVVPRRAVPRVALATVVATSALTVGAVLTALALQSKPSHPDPFAAITLLLGGLGLVITLIAGLRAKRR